MTFEDVLEIKNGKNQRTVEDPSGQYPIYGSGGIMGYARDYICQADTVIVGRKGNINKPIYVDEPFWNVDTAFGLEAKRELLLPRYLYYFCLKYDFEKLNKAVTIPSLTKADLLKINIELPSLQSQTEIVARLRKIEEIILLRQQELKVLDDLVKARFVEMFGDPIKNNKKLQIKRLDELGTWNSGGTPLRTKPEFFTGSINWYSAGELNSLYLDNSIEKITNTAIEESAAKLFKAGSMLVGMYDTAAFKMGILKEASASNQACACIEPNDEVNIVWLYYALSLMKEDYLSQRRGVRQKNLNLGMIRGFELPIAEKTNQDEFVNYVEQVEKSKVAVQKALDEAQILFDSLMQEYFR